ncbi:MAG: glycosyltransferase [Patescibacteria group bacterium]
MQEHTLQPNIAIVCDWMTNWGGAERCLMAVHEIWPDAPIYTLMYDEKKMPEFKDADIRTSYLQKMPLAKKKWQFYLHYMPCAIEQFDLTQYDIVISMSHVVAKGVMTKPSALHICYLYSPTRYMLDYYYLYVAYVRFTPFKIIDSVLKNIVRAKLHVLRQWDYIAAQRPDHIVTISNYIQKRTKKYYRRESTVIYPPVDTQKFQISAHVEDFYLVVGRQVDYKRTDIVIDAFNTLKKPLIIIGNGPNLKKIKQAAGPTVQVLGRLSDEEVATYYSRCKGFIFPQEEDFGITPLEAQAAGRPVIAYRAGGAMETVVENKTGVFFDTQTPESLIDAIERFEKIQFSPEECRKNAEKFNLSSFKESFQSFVEKQYTSFIS